MPSIFSFRFPSSMRFGTLVVVILTYVEEHEIKIDFFINNILFKYSGYKKYFFQFFIRFTLKLQFYNYGQLKITKKRPVLKYNTAKNKYVC